MRINLATLKNLHPSHKQALFILLATLPVLLYAGKASLVYHHGIFGNEDWDYFAQMYEATRQSILIYHQFPWWNPWTMGGVPLFANPQFGLISLQMPLVLVFGTVTGLHVAVLVYFVLGFWGMFLLLKRVGANSALLQALLAYIWIFSGYITWHLAGGHLTFGTYLLAPWFFLTLLNIRQKRGWLWFALVTSFLINQAPHYTMIQCLFIGVFVAVYQIFRFYQQQQNKRPHLMIAIRPYLWSGSLIAVLAAVKLYYGFQYMFDFPRIFPIDPANSIQIIWAGLTSRDPIMPQTLGGWYSWSENANYFGLLTLALFAFLLLKDFLHSRRIHLKHGVLLIAIIFTFITALGAISPFSPYSLLHHFPPFTNMRVSSRWIGWFSFGVVLYLAHLPKKPLIFGLLALSVLDTAIVNYPILNAPQLQYHPPARYARFQQYAGFDYHPDQLTYRLLKATQSNRGEVYGYEPILFFGGSIEPEFASMTNRCGINQGCAFVMTNNAEVIYWSPLKIVLQRTGKGAIQLNMNPGRNWLINGKMGFPQQRILELKEDFIIDDPASQIIVRYKPHID